LDLGFLQLNTLLPANPHYPIGLPLVWRFVSPGEPSALQFRLVHAAFAAALVAAFLPVSRRLGIAPAFGALAASAVAASPLFWDREAIGIGELPPAACGAAG